MIKIAAPNMACQVVDWAIQAFGGGGTSNDFGLAAMYATARLLRLADGPDEVHRLLQERRHQREQCELRRHVAHRHAHRPGRRRLPEHLAEAGQRDGRRGTAVADQHGDRQRRAQAQQRERAEHQAPAEQHAQPRRERQPQHAGQRHAAEDHRQRLPLAVGGDQAGPQARGHRPHRRGAQGHQHPGRHHAGIGRRQGAEQAAGGQHAQPRQQQRAPRQAPGGDLQQRRRNGEGDREDRDQHGDVGLGHAQVGGHRVDQPDHRDGRGAHREVGQRERPEREGGAVEACRRTRHGATHCHRRPGGPSGAPLARDGGTARRLSAAVVHRSCCA
jgi:hypothetical protein